MLVRVKSYLVFFLFFFVNRLNHQKMSARAMLVILLLMSGLCSLTFCTPDRSDNDKIAQRDKQCTHLKCPAGKKPLCETYWVGRDKCTKCKCYDNDVERY